MKTRTNRLVRCLGAGGAALLLAACATSPLGRSQLLTVSDEEMEAMGVQAFQQISEGSPQSRDAAKSAYVNCVANAITSALPEDEG